MVPGGIKSKILYNLFRREFMMKVYRKPLSPDAFSGFGIHDRHVHNAEVRDATTFLMMERVPEFAKALVSRDAAPITRGQLLEMLHEYGINARYLARVRSLIPNEEDVLRRLLLVEMSEYWCGADVRHRSTCLTYAAIRCAKKTLWSALRNRVVGEGDDDALVCRQIVTNFFNRTRAVAVCAPTALSFCRRAGRQQARSHGVAHHAGGALAAEICKRGLCHQRQRW